MSVPSEIRKLLGDRQPTAHASLSSSFQGPIGEAHFIVADGQLFVFQRESLIGEFEPVALDPAHPPKLVPSTFNDELHVALADGSSHELQVSSFDREAIKKVLEENAAPAQESPPQVAPPPEDTSTQQDAQELLQDALEMAKPDNDSGLVDIRQFAEEPPPPVEARSPEHQPAPPESKSGYTTPREVDPDDIKERDEAAKAAEKRGDKNVYYGSDPGCAGCLIQTVIFFGGILAMWFAHEHAMLNIGVVEPTDQYDDSAVFVLTKIVAVIAGMYLGGKTASLLGKLFQKFNWTGFIAFVKDRVLVFGPRNKWQLTIDASRPYELHGAAHTSVEQTQDKSGKPIRVSYNIFLRITQDGKSCVLKTGVYRTGFPNEMSGLPLQPLEEEWKDERLITMEKTTFRNVLRRLQDWQ